ncbi:MAG: hypothetical protein ABL899_02245 [Nitrospira sp.]
MEKLQKKLFFLKILIIASVAVAILLFGSLADNVVYCIKAPCPGNDSAMIAQDIYSKITFNGFFTNNHIAVGIKNFIQNDLNMAVSAGTIYSTISFIITVAVWYILISIFFFLAKNLIKKVKNQNGSL